MTTPSTPHRDIDRQRLIETMRAAVEPLDYVNAMWLAGSTAFARDDQYSDIDAVFDVADGRHVEAFAAIEDALATLAPIDEVLHIPEPAWHGHSQRIYRLVGSPEHLMVDLVIMQRGSTGPRFNEAAIHGRPVVLFDKLGVVTTVNVDPDAHRDAIRGRLATIRTRFFLLRHLAAKEVARQNSLDALWRYNNFVLSPLISLLRTRYAPLFHDFAPRYLKLHLPADVYQRLERLSFVGDFAQLGDKIAEAVAWAEDELEVLFSDGFIDSLPLAEPPSAAPSA